MSVTQVILARVRDNSLKAIQELDSNLHEELSMFEVDDIRVGVPPNRSHHVDDGYNLGITVTFPDERAHESYATSARRARVLEVLIRPYTVNGSSVFEFSFVGRAESARSNKTQERRGSMLPSAISAAKSTAVALIVAGSVSGVLSRL